MTTRARTGAQAELRGVRTTGIWEAIHGGGWVEQGKREGVRVTVGR